MTSPDILNFKKPAEPYNWESRFPLGNGRLGVMLKGDPFSEGLQLNEEHIWNGGPMDRANPSTVTMLPKVRQLMDQGLINEAQEMAYRVMAGSTVNMRAYQNAGDFNIDFFTKTNWGVKGPSQGHGGDTYTNYNLDLDMSRAIATLTYTDQEGTTFTRTTFVSAAHDVVVMHIKSDKPGKINFRGNLERGIWVDSVITDGKSIFLEDAHGVPFCTGATVITKGGQKAVMGTSLCGDNVDEAVFLICINAFDNIGGQGHPLTLADYEECIRNNTWSPKVKAHLDELIARFGSSFEDFDKAFDGLMYDHVAEWKGWYDRMSFVLGDEGATVGDGTGVLGDGTGAVGDTVSTPDLLEIMKASSPDSKSQASSNALFINQYANFGRYLLISCSRTPGDQPANLQGIWNCHMDPPWGSKYTININAQMNYWHANMCNISETELPLFELLARGYERGKIIAQKMYNCSGYVMHHNTDMWGDAAPQDGWVPGTYWTLGSGWLATHIWEHFEYTLDQALLEKYYYLIHEACRFYCDFLQPSKLNAPDGKPYLILYPSASPENTYRTKDGITGVFSPGCEMDNQILTHLFESCLKAHKILGDKARTHDGEKYTPQEMARFEYVLAHIKKPSLNSDGSVMEWNEEFEEPEPGHRHISHLYGLFPGHSISTKKTPDLAQAAKKTLEKRLSSGGGHTGWSQAWIINFRAALEQGDLAGEAVHKILTHSTHPNLLDVHPPFQIDGNFGATAGIMRMIAQSELIWHDDGSCETKIKLLPALPATETWKNGSISGLKLKGDLTLSFKWENWKVNEDSVKISGKTDWSYI